MALGFDRPERTSQPEEKRLSRKKNNVVEGVCE